MNIIHKKSFFVTLTSNSSLNLYPTNTLSHFTTKLPFTLDLNDEWNVGIVKFASTSIDCEEIDIEPKIKFIKTSGGFERDINIFDIIKPHTKFFSIINENFFDRYNENLKLSVQKHTKKYCASYNHG